MIAKDEKKKKNKKQEGIEKMRNLAGILISYLFIGLIIVAAKFFEKSGKEASRKFIHIMLCNWWFIAMYFFDNVIWAAFVPFTFVIINYLSYKRDIIKVMEREKDEQDGLGTVYYAISLLVLSIVTFGIYHNQEAGLVSILIMGYGDGLAAIIGKTLKSYKYKIGDTKKTLAGSATMLIVTFLILSVFFVYMGISFWYLKAILAAIVLTVVEAISIKGTDNITVPIVAFGIVSVVLKFLV